MSLVNRLRGIYDVPVNDGAGLLDGKDTFTRSFAMPPICLQAADEIEALTTELAATQEECEMLRKFAQQCSAAVEANQAELAAKTAEVERLRKIETAACKVFDLPVWSGEDFYDLMIALKYLLHAQPTEPK